MMKKLFTLLLAAACFTTSAQSDIDYPYNPDFENDGFVGIEDVLELLSVYGTPFTPEQLLLDGASLTEIIESLQSQIDSLASYTNEGFGAIALNDSLLTEYLVGVAAASEEGDSTLGAWVMQLSEVVEQQQAQLNSMVAPNSWSLTYPDGTANFFPVFHDFISSGDYIVPEGQNFYVQQFFMGGGGREIEINDKPLFKHSNTVLSQTLKTPITIGGGSAVAHEFMNSGNTDPVASMSGFLVPALCQDTIIDLYLNTYSSNTSESFVVPSGKLMLIQFLAHDDDGGAIHLPFLGINGVPCVEFGESGNVSQSTGSSLPLVLGEGSELTLFPSTTDLVNYGWNHVFGLLIDQESLVTPVFPSDGVSAEENLGPCQGEFTVNYHGYAYELVEIGEQCWFAEDLKSGYFANGDSISYQPTTQSWNASSQNSHAAASAFTNYEYNGFVYNFFAVNDPRGLCPTSWSVPSILDFQEMLDFVGAQQPESSNQSYLQFVNASLKHDLQWNGTNLFGYSATQTFYRLESGSFVDNGNVNWAWSSDIGTFGEAHSFKLEGANNSMSGGTGLITNNVVDQGLGLSVRCIKD